MIRDRFYFRCLRVPRMLEETERKLAILLAEQARGDTPREGPRRFGDYKRTRYLPHAIARTTAKVARLRAEMDALGFRRDRAA
jgi:hypothetical protein